MAYCSNCGTELAPSMKFCPECGSRIGNDLREPAIRKQVYEGSIHKCPNCGEPLNALTAKCPACGHEIRGLSAVNSVQELSEKIDEIENLRVNDVYKQEQTSTISIFKSMLNSYTNKGGEIDKIDEQKASLIKHFAIPNTREDIIEFLILAVSNINPNDYDERSSDTSAGLKLVTEAWISKFEQASQKAKMILGSDDKLIALNEEFKQKKNEIQKLKKASKWAIKKRADERKMPLLLAFIALELIVMGFIIAVIELTG